LNRAQRTKETKADSVAYAGNHCHRNPRSEHQKSKDSKTERSGRSFRSLIQDLIQNRYLALDLVKNKLMLSESNPNLKITWQRSVEIV
jgi:hypothetical protein